MNRARGRVILLVALAVLATACGGGGGDMELGIKRVALSLTFSEEDLAVPVPPRVIRRFVPAPPEFDFAAPTAPRVALPRPPLASLIPTCGRMPAGAAPEQPVGRAVEKPPAPGNYVRRNNGAIRVTGGVTPFQLPFPPFLTWNYGESTEIPRPASEGFPYIVDPQPAGNNWQLDVRKTFVPGFVVTERLLITATNIQLLRRETEANGTKTVFVPDPTIEIYRFGTEGTSWNSAGVDTENDTSMLFQGRIESREVVDVCGTPVDTYRVSVSETIVNLASGEVSGTNANEPNFYNVAPHFGGLVVREDVHTTTRARDPDSGAPVVVELDYVSTVTGVKPLP